MIKAVVVMKRKVNQCVLLAGLRQKLSRYLVARLLQASGPNYHVHKKYFQAVCEMCKDTLRTH